MDMNRRQFLGTLAAGTAAVAGCTSKKEEELKDEYTSQIEPPKGKMTYRTNPTTKDKVSILGYGMMRLPYRKGDKEKGEPDEVINQEQVNKLVDYAMAHGVNYYDTSPAYCQGHSEESTGIALSRYKRSDYFVATKLSNFSPETWSREKSIEMYHNSMKYLQVDYIDYYLLHAIGMGGMESLNGRYIDNGILDYLVEERKAGRIRNLGFSYHGDIKVFDYLLSQHDKYHWDFVQIELNYLDWNFADEMSSSNTDAVYLYGELVKRGIPAVIMEPLLGGRLANLPRFLVEKMKERNAKGSVASWAFRYAGTPEGVLTVLSGMTYMEHLVDNLLTYCPLKPIDKEEDEFLQYVARQIVNMQTVPCTNCKYCMPCPYGVNIPAIFVHYNKCKNEGTLPMDATSADYSRLRRQYLISFDRNIEKLRQPQHCIGCGECMSHCPQGIRIPEQLQKIDKFINELKKGQEIS